MAESLLDRVAGSIPRYSMLEPGSRAGVAVSGGADSIALLHLLQRLAGRFQIGLVVLHVNHQLRGEESAEDERFVRSAATALGLECVTREGPVGDGNLEQEARLVRREFFQNCRANLGLHRVALGHTRSDQAETVLFRLLRGSGLSGLAGMRPVTEDGLIRPLLNVSREEVRAWLRAEGIAWREDSSNSDLRFARNRLRNELMPRLAADFNPNLEGVLAGTAALAQAEEAYWAEQVEPIYHQIAKRTQLGSILQVEALTIRPVAIQRRLLRRAFLDVRGDLRSIDFEHVEAVLALCNSTEGHDRVLVPGIDALRSFSSLLLTTPGELKNRTRHYHLDLRLGVEAELPFGAGKILVSAINSLDKSCVNFKEDPAQSEEICELDAGFLERNGGRGSIYVRNWEPGDCIERGAGRGAEKIKHYFQRERVLLWQRRHWPVLVSGEEVVWTRGFGGSVPFVATSETRDKIWLAYRPCDE